METYTISNDLTIDAKYYETSKNWGHKAYAIYKGKQVAECKIVYQNRTWEAYRYQSVMQKLVNKMLKDHTITQPEAMEAMEFLKTGDNRDLKGLEAIGNLATLAGIIGGNETKARLLSTIDGLDLNSNTLAGLTEAEKSKRLDGAINILTNI